MGQFANRRKLFCGIAAAAATVGLSRQTLGQHANHGGLYESLQKPGRHGPPELAPQQHVFDSPAPKATPQGRWTAQAELPIPRSEMAWAASDAERMHLVGGYGEQRVDRPYHQVFSAHDNRWSERAPLPKGANHVGVAFLDGRLYALGGFEEQNRRPHALCFVYDGTTDKWASIAPLPKPCGAVGSAAVNGMMHLIGGAVGDTFATKKSVDWHWAYDPKADRWADRQPMPTGRDHTGTLTVDHRIHVIGGRVDSFHTNSNLHHVYDPMSDQWTPKRPLPTARSGHGAVLLRGKIFCMGGEGTDRVYGQNEAYDVATDTWAAYTPMLTPRHGLGAARLGDAIYVAGGGAVMGGGVQSAVHEAFTLT